MRASRSRSHSCLDALVADPQLIGATDLDKQHPSDAQDIVDHASNIDKKSGTTISIREFLHENYKRFDIIVKLSQVTEVAYPLCSVND